MRYLPALNDDSIVDGALPENNPNTYRVLFELRCAVSICTFSINWEQILCENCCLRRNIWRVQWDITQANRHFLTRRNLGPAKCTNSDRIVFVVKKSVHCADCIQRSIDILDIKTKICETGRRLGRAHTPIRIQTFCDER